MVLPLQRNDVFNNAVGQAFFNLRLHHIQYAGALVKAAHQQRRRVAARTSFAKRWVAGAEKQPLVIALYPKMQAVGKRCGIAGHRVVLVLTVKRRMPHAGADSHQLQHPACRPTGNRAGLHFRAVGAVKRQRHCFALVAVQLFPLLPQRHIVRPADHGLEFFTVPKRVI